jgi:hypothetical protein
MSGSVRSKIAKECRMNYKIAQTLCLLTIITIATPSFADDPGKALDEIASFAERVCQTAPIKSQSEELQLSGKADAELKGLLSKVANLGVTGAAQYKKTESEGVLQKDLASLLSKGEDCKQNISNKLIDKLITNASIEKKRFAVKLRGNAPIPGQVSGVSFDLYIDDNQLSAFSNLKGSPAIDVGNLDEGAHTFRFENITGYFMDVALGPQVVPQASGLQCDGQFTVAHSKTYQVVVWLDGSGLKCDLR